MAQPNKPPVPRRPGQGPPPIPGDRPPAPKRVSTEPAPFRPPPPKPRRTAGASVTVGANPSGRGAPPPPRPTEVDEAIRRSATMGPPSALRNLNAPPGQSASASNSRRKPPPPPAPAPAPPTDVNDGHSKRRSYSGSVCGGLDYRDGELPSDSQPAAAAKRRSVGATPEYISPIDLKPAFRLGRRRRADSIATINNRLVNDFAAQNLSDTTKIQLMQLWENRNTHLSRAEMTEQMYVNDVTFLEGLAQTDQSEESLRQVQRLIDFCNFKMTATALCYDMTIPDSLDPRNDALPPPIDFPTLAGGAGRSSVASSVDSEVPPPVPEYDGSDLVDGDVNVDDLTYLPPPPPLDY